MYAMFRQRPAARGRACTTAGSLNSYGFLTLGILVTFNLELLGHIIFGYPLFTVSLTNPVKHLYRIF
ncbi:MAG: hypothetical protein ACUZ8H_12690, partial [Candidatus Anammoxibacter sp.]